jgi:hypothetical protein
MVEYVPMCVYVKCERVQYYLGYWIQNEKSRFSGQNENFCWSGASQQAELGRAALYICMILQLTRGLTSIQPNTHWCYRINSPIVETNL